VLLPGAVKALMEARGMRPERPVVVGARMCNPDGSEQTRLPPGEVTPLSTF
jgi:hypothetical protein